MLTIYTGHHLNTVTPNIDLELSTLDTPETTIQKATDVFEQSKTHLSSSEPTTFFSLIQSKP